MYRDYQIVLCIPCGRRKYLEVLLPALQHLRDCIDVCEMWMNTLNEKDREFCLSCCDVYPGWLKTVDLNVIPTKEAWRTVHPFYRHCCDSNTVYIKCDDDVTFVDRVDAFHAFLDFRIDHPEYFLISANIVNSPVCTHFHQAAGLLPGLKRKVAYDWQDRYGMSGRVAESAHMSLIANGPAAFYMDDVTFDNFERFSINFVSWLGEDFAAFSGDVPEVDEEWLTTTKSRAIGRKNIIFGNFVIAHFAFGKQRAHMDGTNLLEDYKKWLLPTKSQ